MSTTKTASGADSNSKLIEGQDYYSEGAAIVFTARYLLRRGYCCESGCRHCPYTELGEMNPRSNPSLIEREKED
jgi:hypothetical protein